MEKSNCDSCKASLERGGVTYYNSAGDLTREYCFDCGAIEKFNEYKKDRNLTTNFVTSCIVTAQAAYNNRKIKDYQANNIYYILEVDKAHERLCKKGNTFEQEVWFNGLQKIVNKANKGISAKYENVNVLSSTSGGRCLITLAREITGENITYIVADDSKEATMGFQGICATLEEAVSLVDDVIKFWKDKKLNFVENEKVRIAGF